VIFTIRKGRILGFDYFRDHTEALEMLGVREDAQESVDWPRRLYEAFERNDLDGLLALHDPQCEISPVIAQLEAGGSYRGLDGVRAFWRDLHEAFPDWVPAPEEGRELGDTLIVKLHFHGRGLDSGAAVDRVVWQAVRLRNGRAVWWAIYFTEAEALEAATLRE
jgi:ketosteroid isomerase-like protein